MIRLATVFSGIGAIEHALKRMGIDYKIVFACDNGEVDIFTKHVERNIDKIKEEIEILNIIINELEKKNRVEDVYQQQLIDMFQKMNAEYVKIVHIINSVTEPKFDLESVLDKIIQMDNLKNLRKKEYLKFQNELKTGSILEQRLKEFQVILKLVNDFKKDNDIIFLGDFKDFKSVDNIKWSSVSVELKGLYEHLEKYDGKKVLKKVQDISQRIGQLHEKINYLRVQKQLETFGDNWQARKKYVDQLYLGQEKKNKVRTSYMANYCVSDDDFHWNAAFLNGKQYRNKVDLFVGGSPCQSFSLVGKQRGLDDTRGTLFYEYARLINEINPKIFIYENVRAVMSNNNGKTWEKMQEVFSKLGYKFYSKVLNAKNYGIPQNRERLFVVGFRNDIAQYEPFSFPKEIKLERTMKDFLLDNVPGGYFLPTKGVEFVTREKNIEKKYTQIDGNIQLCQKKNQQFNWHGDFVFQSEKEAIEKHIPDLEKYFLSEKVKKYVLSTGTKNFYSKPKVDLDVARPLLTTMHKMHRAGIDNYVTTDGRLRKLTPRECLRLMGFSDDFKIVVANTPMYQQAGNSIVVDVLIAILKQIHIEKYGDDL